MAFEVLHRAEDALAEKAVTLGLVGAVVDRFRLDHLTVAALEDLLGARQADDDLVELARQLHLLLDHSHGAQEFDLLLLSPSFSRLTSKVRPRSSCRRTLNDSGMPGTGIGSPFTIAS